MVQKRKIKIKEKVERNRSNRVKIHHTVPYTMGEMDDVFLVQIIKVAQGKTQQ